MRDELNRNPLAVTGTPSLVTGALTVDPDQALQFNGTTNSAAALDSTSLSITGSFSIECFVRLTAYPGSTQNLVVKTGSYSIQVTSAGLLAFNVAGASSSVGLLSNVALSLNTWYHIVCVYNGNYSGVPQFGKTSLGSSNFQVDDTNGNNKAVSKFTLAESALLRTVNVALEYPDEVWNVQMCAVVYADSSGLPGALVSKSEAQILSPPNPQWRNWTWVSFPLNPAVFPAGSYHVGFVADTIGADIPKAALIVNGDSSGGVVSRRPDSATGPSDPFGSVAVSSTEQRAIYCDYTAVGRTGREGKALIYINGALNSSSVYSGGVADTANTLQICPTLAAQVDEVSIWNRALTDVQIATHYNAH